MALSESQKKYEKKRAKKVKVYAVKYGMARSEQAEARRLQDYLDRKKITANAYIKALIQADLDRKNVPYADLEDLDHGTGSERNI